MVHRAVLASALRGAGLKGPKMKERIADEFYLSMFDTASSHLETAGATLQESADAAALVEQILRNRTAEGGLSLEQSALLLHLVRNAPDPEIERQVIDAARTLRGQVFGDKVATMVPVEATSYCASSCKFCGWRSDNREMVRSRITVNAIRTQARTLAAKGISHFEIVGGDDLRFFKTDLEPMIQALKEETTAVLPEARVSMCFTAMHEEHYEQFKASGLDCVLTWQETYSEDLYNFHISSGPKATGINRDFQVEQKGNGFLDRLKSNESAVRVGLQVGIGSIIGLADNTEADILSVIMHGRKLAEHYPEEIQPIIIGMPAWNAITTTNTDNRMALGFKFDDFESRFELISSIYLLGFPDHLAWVFANGRVSPEIQMDCIETAACFTSTLVQIAPGGYLEFDDDGNLIGDHEQMFLKSTVPLDELKKDIVLSGEQFSHYFATHEEYLAMFADRQLTAVPDNDFIVNAVEANRVSKEVLATA